MATAVVPSATPDSGPVPTPGVPGAVLLQESIPTKTPAAKPTSVLWPTLPPAAPPAPARGATPAVAAGELEALVGGNTAFALDLYEVIAGSEENLFYSPYSISLALAMTYAGARGATERQMAETLRFSLLRDRLHPAFNALDLALTPEVQGGAKGGFELSIANSVWGQEGHEFSATYLDTLAENYGGDVRRVDYRGQPETARTTINDWVSGETTGRIEDLIPRQAITTWTRLVLANAVFLRAKWQLPFDERATSRAPFHSLDGEESRVEMMRQTGGFGFARGDGFEAVELPYEGGGISLVILLPHEGRFGDIERSLDADRLGAVLEGLETRRVRLTMPKFELEATLGLADTLEGMGMPNAFDEKKAEFQGMDGLSCLAGDDECLLISDVVHKAFVSVDEDGTEAAAATAVVVGITKSVIIEELVELTIDRPFIFLIRHRETGTVLFLGRVVKL